jgi:hypothetical protein
MHLGAVAEIMLVRGPSMALATISALSSLVASSRHRRLSRMVSTPIVIALWGTCSGRGNSSAFCSRVTGDSTFTRVQGVKDRQRLVKSQVTVFANAQQLHANAPTFPDELFMMRAFRREIRSPSGRWVCANWLFTW